MSAGKDKAPEKSGVKPSREERLKSALKRNIRRRKQAAAPAKKADNPESSS